MRSRCLAVALSLGLGACYTSTDFELDDDTLWPGTTVGVVTTGGQDTQMNATSGPSAPTTTASTGEASTGEVSTSGPSTDPWTTGSVDETTTGDDPPDETTSTSTSTTTTTGEPDSTTTGPDDPPPDPCPRVKVTVPPGDVLNVRPTPSTDQAPVGTLPSGAIVDVLAIVDGQVIDGNGTWYHIDGYNLTGYIWGGWAVCTMEEQPPPSEGFYLPLTCGTKATVSQGNFGNFSHQGQSAYAFDFSLGTGTPLVAIEAGTVHKLYNQTKPGHPCYNGGGQECSGHANYVTLLHGDGTTSIYAHLSEVTVSLGQQIPRGVSIGLSGSTGWSTGRHAHVARQQNCGGGWCQSIAVAFVDVPGDGVPVTNQQVTSGNCP